MQIKPLNIEGAYEITPRQFNDERGYFVTYYERKLFEEHGLQTAWLRENQAGNNLKGILRGFHFQVPPYAETKLVRVSSGKVLDVFIDIRKSSATYGQFEMIELSEERKNLVYIPKGCAHAYLTMTDRSIVCYKVDNVYAPQAERGIAWNDPTLNIPWNLEAPPILSAKDQKWQAWVDFESPFD